MPGNSFGEVFRITTFGESHGKAIGVIIDGCPPGILIQKEMIQSELDRRKPGQSSIVTQRKESDTVEILSGIFENKTTGTPIAMMLFNKDAKSSDYDHIKDKFRPSHADFVYEKKYGIRDYRGGGRSSARETAARVAAGAIAKQILEISGIQIAAYVDQVGKIVCDASYDKLDLATREENAVRCPDPTIAEQMIELIKKTRKEGDTIGGSVRCVIRKVPIGLGEPVFDKLHADLGKAILSINACKGFEIGSGFAGIEMNGSEHNDTFVNEDGSIKTSSNYSGGVQGGISNGMDIYFRAAFKPVSTLMSNQNSVDSEGNEVEIKGKGRHDPCVVPRAVPIVEAMASIVITDHLLRNKLF